MSSTTFDEKVKHDVPMAQPPIATPVQPYNIVTEPEYEELPSPTLRGVMLATCLLIFVTKVIGGYYRPDMNIAGSVPVYVLGLITMLMTTLSGFRCTGYLCKKRKRFSHPQLLSITTVSGSICTLLLAIQIILELSSQDRHSRAMVFLGVQMVVLVSHVTVCIIYGTKNKVWTSQE